MLINTAEHNTIVNAIIIVVLVLEFAVLLWSVRSRSLFASFATMAIFSGSIGGMLMINAYRDWSAHFTPYQTVKGVKTWTGTKALFWANIDPSFIEAFMIIAIISAIPASILFVLHGRRQAALLKKIEEMKQEIALLKQNGSKRTPAKTSSASDAKSSPREDDADEADAKSKRRPQSPIQRRHEAHSLA